MKEEQKTEEEEMEREGMKIKCTRGSRDGWMKMKA